MMPGGHLATSLALAGVVYVTTGSVETAAGCLAGGFFIDLDHYLDYLVFEKQWRRPGPISFLRYYFSSSPRRLVLPLHSAEFMAFLFGLILTTNLSPWLVGYWVGALMHLTFDVLVNGDVGLKKPVLFYFFAYRARYRFAAAHLIRANVSLEPSRRPIRDFFRWRPAEERPSESTLVQRSS